MLLAADPGFATDSDSAFTTAPRVATYLRRGSGSERHSSITASKIAGLNGLRRQRAAPSLVAILRKSGSVAAKAYPEIAIGGTVEARR